MNEMQMESTSLHDQDWGKAIEESLTQLKGKLDAEMLKKVSRAITNRIGQAEQEAIYKELLEINQQIQLITRSMSEHAN